MGRRRALFSLPQPPSLISLSLSLSRSLSLSLCTATDSRRCFCGNDLLKQIQFVPRITHTYLARFSINIAASSLVTCLSLLLWLLPVLLSQKNNTRLFDIHTATLPPFPSSGARRKNRKDVSKSSEHPPTRSARVLMKPVCPGQQAPSPPKQAEGGVTWL